MEHIEQQVVNDNKQIYARIISELSNAEFEILIAVAWFTDEDLFQILSRKLDEGVRISIIVADNQENERLDFSILEDKGAEVIKRKSAGYGVMNQKFCVIDKRIAIHGSYNWTMNAKKNNQESVIITNHEDTVKALIDTFEQKRREPGPVHIDGNQLAIQSNHSRPQGIPVEIPIRVGEEFEKLLNSMIAAEVGNFDRTLLRQQGYDRCNANNGDHQVLYKAFDTLYSVFINDIDVIDDKKKRLIAKIEEHRVKNTEILSNNAEHKISFLERKALLDKDNLINRNAKLDAEIEKAENHIHEINTIKVPFYENDEKVLRDEIEKIEHDLVRPKIKWFVMIPTIIFNAALLIYIFIFYSSAAYILLFSVSDAKEDQLKNIPLAEARVFNPDAISKAFEKGGAAPWFIFLFVFIPLAASIADFFYPKKWVPFVSFLLGIIILDGAVAYNVSHSVYEVNYLSGTVNEKWLMSMAFTDTSFYMVFVLGAFGLLLFKVAFKKLLAAFEERSPDRIAQQLDFKKEQLKLRLNELANQIISLKGEITAEEMQIINFRKEIREIMQELETLPLALNLDLQKERRQLSSDLKLIDEIAAIYTAHIQSDNLPISVDALKDRINVFLEGWNDCLCDEFSVVRASTKTKQAADEAFAWQQQKIQINKVDKRVKLHSGE